MYKEKSNGLRRIRTPLRLHFALASTLTLCISSVVCCGAVVGVVLFAHIPLTKMSVVMMGIAICALTMLTGGLLLWTGAAHLTRPINELNDAVKKVASGHFDIQIKRKTKPDGDYEYTNELDELAVNFNKMTEELNGMDYMRKDFMSNVSHEIKTPVAAITGFAEILMDGGLTEGERQEYLELVHDESIRLSRLCESMLRMARLDHQEIVKLEDRVQIDELIRRCVIIISERWEVKNIQYELDLDKNVLTGNRDLLQEIWINLIDNAAKYSERGKSVFIKEYRQGRNIVVEITDQGIGIAPENLERIYDRFYQSDESHKKEGSGLGLAIVRRIVEMLSGSISCESMPGQGTKFTVFLPADTEASADYARVV